MIPLSIAWYQFESRSMLSEKELQSGEVVIIVIKERVLLDMSLKCLDIIWK